MKLDLIKRPISTIRLFEGTLFVKSKKHEFYKQKFFKLFSDRLNIYNVKLYYNTFLELQRIKRSSNIIFDKCLS